MISVLGEVANERRNVWAWDSEGDQAGEGEPLASCVSRHKRIVTILIKDRSELDGNEAPLP
jgi:hypothetical protein